MVRLGMDLAFDVPYKHLKPINELLSVLEGEPNSVTHEFNRNECLTGVGAIAHEFAA